MGSFPETSTDPENVPWGEGGVKRFNLAAEFRV